MTEFIQSDWIKANEALRKLDPLLGRLQAKQTIAEYLRDGEIVAWASQVWESSEVSIGRAWKGTKKSNLLTEVQLEPVIFRASKKWAMDQADWRWPFNNFSITIGPPSNRRRKLLRGVQFRRDQIQKIADEIADTPNRFNVVIPTPTSNAGRKIRKADWDSFWFEVVAIAQRGDLNQDNYPSQASFTQDVLTNARGLDAETVKPVVRQIFQKFIPG